MPTGLSLHLGLNYVNPDRYGGWDGELAACEFDAHDMQALAAARGFQTQQLLRADCTSANVIAALRAAAARLKKGDLFFLTYSGHGGQVPDVNGDELDNDRQDETWCLYDRQLIDDELWTLWGRFKAGVRILVLSDSCHSGTATNPIPPFLPAGPGAGPAPKIRMMPLRVGRAAYKAHRREYDAIQKAHPAAERARVRSSVLLISGCQDNQFSLDGPRNGLFTGTLRRVWNKGRFRGDHRTFRDHIAARMPASQTPNYFVVGKVNPAFEKQTPFTV